MNDQEFVVNLDCVLLCACPCNIIKVNHFYIILLYDYICILLLMYYIFTYSICICFLTTIILNSLGIVNTQWSFVNFLSKHIVRFTCYDFIISLLYFKSSFVFFQLLTSIISMANRFSVNHFLVIIGL